MGPKQGVCYHNSQQPTLVWGPNNPIGWFGNRVVALRHLLIISGCQVLFPHFLVGYELEKFTFKQPIVVFIA